MSLHQNEDSFPDFFYSRQPLTEKVEAIPIPNSKNAQFYWMLSVESQFSNSQHQSLAPYNDNDDELIDCADLEDNYEINPTKSGKYITSFSVPGYMLGAIVGSRGTKLREFQETTNTLIKIPKPDEPPIIKITGLSERSVASARTQISLFILAKKEKLAITHFVSIRIFSSEIQSNFLKFKKEILQSAAPPRGVEESIFQNSEKLHLTIVPLILLCPEEIEEAKNILLKNQENFAKAFSKPPKILLKGVEIMNDDPGEVDVLYGKVELENIEDTDRFQRLANEIFDCFSRSGLVKKQFDNVKLHVTLLNSRYRHSDNTKNDSTKNKRVTFDASLILDQYKNFYFGNTVFNQLHLSIRTPVQSGYYESEVTINL